MASFTDLLQVQDRLEKLRTTFKEKTKEKESLEKQVNICAKKLDRAEKLIGGLGGERTRWAEAASNLQSVYENLTGDVLVASGVIAYLGAFTSYYREVGIKDWTKYCKVSYFLIAYC